MKKNLLRIFVVTLIVVFSFGMQSVYAGSNTALQVTSSQVMEKVKADFTQINYYKDASKTTKTGSVQVKYQDSTSYLTPVMLEAEAIYDMDNNDLANISVELNPNNEAGYRAPDSYIFGSQTVPLSETRFDLSIAGGTIGTLDFDFVKNGPPPGPDPEDGGDKPGPMFSYPLVAYFSGINTGVEMNNEGKIMIPDGWTSGTVAFKAKIFTEDDETIEQYEGQQGGETVREEKVAIEGIANLDEINNTASTIPSEELDKSGGPLPAEFVMIYEGFSEYGKLQLHIVKAENSNLEVNQLLTVVHKNLINIQANAHIPLSQSFGTVALNQAIITKDELKDVKIFFGNNESSLVVSGPTVDKITTVEGGKSVILNGDGSATVTLPGLDKETATPVKVTILKRDGTSITRHINIVRTVIQLQHNYGGGDDTVYAGYVVNKGYLYNNQPHNDDIFNAYLQVVLYKDDIVAGYKQIKIDDEALVNGLQDDESGSLELYSDKQIPVYGKEAGGLIKGVNKISVFLTNGPIDFNGDTLPSVEFGIGSGVTCEWGDL